MMSRAWYLLCFVPIAICVTIAIVLFAGLVSDVENMPRFVIPGTHSLKLEPGDYVAFGETESKLGGVVITNSSFRVQCALAGDAGPITLDTGGAKTNYSMGDYRGSSFYKFTIATAGTYRFDCRGDERDAVLAIGHGIGGAIVKAIVMVFAGIISGGVFFLLIFLRRQKAKRAAAQQR